MAPSPTGPFHIGSVRTALFNYLYARHFGGKFILRIEDTDKGRSKKEFEENIVESFKWLGLEFDEFYRQSERTAIYKKYLEKLIADGKAYVSKEEVDATENKERRPEVIRFRNPKLLLTFHDEVLGEINIDTTDLGDFVIAKNLEEPLYHLTVVVDDFEMGVTHVIRGQDHVSNTPRQILILEAIGAPRPRYAHIPLILSPDKSKLSKRHGALSTLEYRDEGYLPEALLNFMALIGWNPGDEREIFTLPELIKEFKLDRVQRSPGVFNTEKLDWINREHLKRLPFEVQVENVSRQVPSTKYQVPKDLLLKIAPIIIERISKWGDIPKMMAAGEWRYFFEQPQYDREGLVWKKLAGKPEQYSATKANLEEVHSALNGLSEGSFDEGKVKEAIWPITEKSGRGEVLWPMRFALSGAEKSPDPFVLSAVLGKKMTLERIKLAIDKLGNE